MNVSAPVYSSVTLHNSENAGNLLLIFCLFNGKENIVTEMKNSFHLNNLKSYWNLIFSMAICGSDFEKYQVQKYNHGNRKAAVC